MKRPHGRQTAPAARKRTAPQWIATRRMGRRIRRAAIRSAAKIEGRA